MVFKATHVRCVAWISVLEGTRDGNRVAGSNAAAAVEADLGTANVELSRL